MRILLIDFDSKIPNLALMKLSASLKQQGHIVGFDVQDPDEIYVSIIFSKNRGQAAGLKMMYPNSKITFGGPGWNLTNTLPKEIEFIKPDYDLYPSTFSLGFATRGCIRYCKFCIVPKKEGDIRVWQHPSEFHDTKFKTCVLLDNNFFAAPQNYVRQVLEWFADNKIKMDMTQGYDARLLTGEYAELLKPIMPNNGVRFSWDNIIDEKIIKKSIDTLSDAGIDLKHKVSFHVLCGFDSTFEQDLYRCNKLREWGVNAFVMQYHKRNPKIRKLAKWANRRWAYWSSPFEGAQP